MISTSSATQTPTTPQSNASAPTATAVDAAPAASIDHVEVAAVAGADEDAVEREDGSVQRLHQREHRPERLGTLDRLGVPGEDAREHADERHHHRGEQRACEHRHGDHPGARRERAFAVVGAEHSPHDHLPGDRDRVEHEREERPELERDLVRAERRVAEPSRHGAGRDERAVEGGRAQEDVAPELEQPAQQRRVEVAVVRAGPGT